jgi:hypothetical protein
MVPVQVSTSVRSDVHGNPINTELSAINRRTVLSKSLITRLQRWIFVARRQSDDSHTDVSTGARQPGRILSFRSGRGAEGPGLVP